ncbi:MAG: hypothetical protein K6F57_03235 [Candidatus Saccharibacteria bacterium]|nr:hypothetical protein [Candidatus Saccharibacteria bacterium]
MDNQNANNGGFPQNPNPPQDNNQQPPVPNQAPVDLENLRTQSAVESSRDVAEKELAAQEAYNNRILKQQQAAIRHDKEMHIAVKVVLVIFGILILVALIWLIIQIIIGAGQGSKTDACTNADGTINASCCDRPEYKDKESCKEQKDPLPTIDGYKCTKSDCKKMADIVKNERIIIYDEKYYIYDIKANTATPTTINNTIKYNSMSVFEWGTGNYYVILKPATEDYGLYSIKDNQQIIPNKLSRVYSDIKHKAYKGMEDILGKYILVRESSQYRLYDIKTGEELASAAEGVFTYKKYIMTYQTGGVRRVYNFNGKQLFITTATDEVYMRDGYVILFGKNFYVYDNNGVRQNATKNAVMKEINKVKRTERANYLKKTKSFYRMPTSRDYED